MTVRVILEAAPRRSFASVLDWPGWARSGRTPEAALDALVAYAPRYAEVAARANLDLPSVRSPQELDVIARDAGGGSTEFGIPSVATPAEAEPVSDVELGRFVALMRAAWTTFDAAYEAAAGRVLTTGPRGGGRPLDKIRDHVRDAEVAYIAQLGARTPDPERTRETFLETLRAVATGNPVAQPRRTQKPWTPRYAVRRAAWHVLDHAWEIEDRSCP